MDELYHYGVLGMRWGVRKDPKRAYSRASKKLKDYGARINTSRKRASKYYEQADRKSYSFFSTRRGVQKAFARANRSQRRVNQLIYRGSNWYKEMEKAFANQSVVSISDEDRKLGQSLIDEVLRTSKTRYENQYYNRYSGYDDGRRR